MMDQIEISLPSLGCEYIYLAGDVYQGPWSPRSWSHAESEKWKPKHKLHELKARAGYKSGNINRVIMLRSSEISLSRSTNLMPGHHSSSF